MKKVILLDIEGTIAPISFVKEVMFPYSKNKLEKFLKENKDKEEIKKIIEEVEKIEGKKLTLSEVIEILKRWIDEDKKITPLKDLQGYIWKEGFEKGELKAPIYEDAIKKIKEWKNKGYKIYIYSSGSVQAQKLFFSHTNYGNILNMFDGHFDTKIGNKKDKNSYLKIAKEIGVEPKEIIFLSDDEKEIESSIEAGLKGIKVSRKGDKPFIENYPYEQIKSFEELNF
jgi:enolase-phosphatase E1